MAGRINNSSWANKLNGKHVFGARLGEEGIVSNLNYAFRLVNIPQAIFAVTIATIVFPIIAKARSESNMIDFRKGIEKGILYLLIFLTPALAGMCVLMQQLVTLVYESGAFTSSSTRINSIICNLIHRFDIFLFNPSDCRKRVLHHSKRSLHNAHRIDFSITKHCIELDYLENIGAEGIALSASLVAFFTLS